MPLRRFTLVTHMVRKGDGQGRVNFEVVKEALRRDLSVTVVASEIAPELQANPGITWHRIRVPGFFPSLLAERWFAASSSRILRRDRSGPLVSNGCITTVPADLNACHFVHSSWLKSPVHPGRLRGGAVGAYYLAYSALNAKWERKAYQQARQVVAVSEQVRRELIDIGIDAGRIVAVPNGVDAEEFAPAPSQRAKFGLAKDGVMALFAGDLRSPRKNLDTVLKAMREEPRIRLVVAGWLEGSSYPQMARDLGVADRVEFIGNCREMPALMASCDIFAFPSRYEACSLVMLEAMAAGLPVVTCRTTGGAELVPEDGGFLMDDPEDLPGLVAIFRQVCDTPGELASMSRKARERGALLRWDEMGRRYLELLENQCASST